MYWHRHSVVWWQLSFHHYLWWPCLLAAVAFFLAGPHGRAVPSHSRGFSSFFTAVSSLGSLGFWMFYEVRCGNPWVHTLESLLIIDVSLLLRKQRQLQLGLLQVSPAQCSPFVSPVYITLNTTLLCLISKLLHSRTKYNEHCLDFYYK